MTANVQTCEQGGDVAKRITLADVAQRAGVSVTTASFVLSKRPNTRISQSTAERVRAAAAELGYAADKTARGLRTGRSDAIGFISDEVTVTRYASAMIRGILNVGQSTGRAVLMAETDHQPVMMEKAVRVMLSRRIDGLAIGLMRARMIQIPSNASSLPTVIVNGTAEGTPSILPDEYQAGVDAVTHLAGKGHSRIAFIGRSAAHRDPRVSVTIGRRLDGIAAGMTAAGLEFAYQVPGHDWEPELGYSGAQEILDSSDATAIVAANDRVAFGVYQAAAERGLVIGRELSVISFDDEQLATYLRPQVTTLRIPYLEMGEIGSHQLLEAIADGDETGKGDGDAGHEVLVPMPLIERGSVADLNADPVPDLR